MFSSGFAELFAFAALLLPSSTLVSAISSTGAPKTPINDTEWSGWGANIYNNRWAAQNTQINSSTIGDLVENCKITYPVGVSATPVVLDDIAYYPTSNGSFYALHLGTCEYVWAISVAEIIYNYATPSTLQTTNCLAMSRTSPQIDGDVLYFSTQMFALLVAVNITNGEFLGNVQVSDHPLAICTQSPTFYNGQIFQGASSQEESATLDPSYDCCDFVGVFKSYTFDKVKKTFTQVWQVTTMPENQGWSGATVWGSQPAIDPTRNQVFIGTGNTYTYPKEYEKCVNESSSCLPDDVWQESVIALDIDTGKVNWRVSISSLDGWVMACGYANAPVSSSPLCPGRPGPDADFAMAPTFVPAALGDGTTGNDSVVIGQKNGNLYNFNAATGDITWQIITSPGVLEAGGLSWGVAVDDASIYYTAIDYGAANWTLTPSNLNVNNSAWGAANLKTGEIMWNTDVPNGLYAFTPPGVVNDIIFTGQGGSNINYTSTNPGAVVALAKSNGNILQTWPVDSVQRGGVAVHGGFVLFGSGYHYNSPFSNGSFYVYGLPDAIKAAKASETAKPKVSATPSTTPATGDEPGASSTPTAGSGKKSGASRTIVLGTTPGSDRLAFAVYPIVLLAVFMIILA